MRISTYEIILPLIGKGDKTIEGKSLLCNGLYGALDVVDAETAEKLDKGDISDIPFALRERLTVRGHITCKDETGELNDARLLGRVWSKLVGHAGIGPVILPTYDCNFRCPYCFERHRLCRGQEWLDLQMKPEMVEAVFAALEKQRKMGRKIDGVTLYGGEPFMKENKETVRNICTHAKEMGLGLSGITNGYDLDGYIDLLEEFGFKKLQVTVDGVGKLNDRRRLHRDGMPTYDRILQNVALVLDHGVDVSLRVNVNGDNIGGIKALMDDLAARSLTESTGNEQKGSFSYYFKAVSEDLDSPTRVTEKQVMDEILAAGIQPVDAIEKQSQYSMIKTGLDAAMKKEHYPAFSTAFCGAEQGMMCIAPDGLLYPCWDLVAKEEDAVGFTDVETGRFFFNFAKAKWRTRTSDLMDACQTCPYILICRGGCAPEAKRMHGSYFRESCGECREIFAFVASRIVGQKWEETKEDELSASLAGPISRLTEQERNLLMTTTNQQVILDIVKKAGLFISSAEEK